jgi:hypothetical protein
LLSADDWTLYRALRDGRPAPPQPEIGTAAEGYIPDRLRLLAERWACDDAVAALRALGVRAFTVTRTRDQPGGIHYIEAAARMYDGDAHDAAVDADAAMRVVQRIRAGLTPAVALARTLAQCDRPTYSEGALRDLERAADAHVRYVEMEDRQALRRAGLE